MTWSAEAAESPRRSMVRTAATFAAGERSSGSGCHRPTLGSTAWDGVELGRSVRTGGLGLGVSGGVDGPAEVRRLTDEPLEAPFVAGPVQPANRTPPPRTRNRRRSGSAGMYPVCGVVAPRAAIQAGAPMGPVRSDATTASPATTVIAVSTLPNVMVRSPLGWTAAKIVPPTPRKKPPPNASPN